MSESTTTGTTPSDPAGKKILMIMTTGPEDPDKTYAPFYTAALMAAMEIETSMYFLMHAPELLRKGAAEKVPLKKGGNLKMFVDMALENGVKFLACAESCRDLCEIAPSDLIDGVKLVGSATLADLALDADSVVSF
jgi:predicted peroxiredoxin